MIAVYEQACDRENVETTESCASASRRQTNHLAIASFVCNLVCLFAACLTIHTTNISSVILYFLSVINTQKKKKSRVDNEPVPFTMLCTSDGSAFHCLRPVHHH